RLAGAVAALRPALRGVADLHSFRLVILPPDARNGGVTRLLFNTVHDRPLREHLASLFDSAGAELTEVLAAAGLPRERAALIDAIACQRVRENTLYLGAINKSVGEILAEARLREELGRRIDARLAGDPWPAGTPAETIRRQLRDELRRDPGAGTLPLEAPAKRPRWAEVLRIIDLALTLAFPAMGVLARDMAAAIGRVGDRLARGATWFGWGLWWVYGGVPTGLALAGVRVVEALERDLVAPAPDPQAVARFEAEEDRHLKNTVTLYVPVKPWWSRRRLMAVILWGSERGTRHFWTAGALADIDTIHYARIFQVDGGRSMLFLSDYDGSLNRYLDDFIGAGSRAVVPISSNLAGCPPTRWLFGQADPATFDARWRGMIRRYQLAELLWYNAYPDLAVSEILANARIRAGLVADALSEDEARLWTQSL
ncbi:MAG TPA: hypothetical protein VLT83_15740, partial [Opitutaceae bacterium]|nr:hypothetical protein [Opitutaceae bacterium]